MHILCEEVPLNNRGILTVVSGFSGAGKGTIMKELTSKYPEYALSISATTRARRKNEIHGREYFFVSEKRFREMIEKEELYEYAVYSENYYGTPRAYVDEQLNLGRDVILEIEVQGAEKIKKQFPDTVLVFVAPPGAEELRTRLIGRGTETEDSIKKRLLRAVEEAEYMSGYDYILINDKLDESVDALHAMIQSERRKSRALSGYISDISKELRKLTADYR